MAKKKENKMKAKKIVFLCVAVIFVYAICACTKKNDSQNNGEKETTLEQSQTLKYYYEYENQKVYIAQRIEEAVLILGDDYEYFEAPSCAAKGMDMFYYYQNLTIMANEIDGEKIIVQIYFKNDTIATPEGIRINSLYADVVNQYGTDYNMNGTALEYSSKNTLFIIDFKDGKVASIEYQYK